MAEEKYHPLKSPYHPLKSLAAMLHGSKDEIPAEIIHSKDNDRRYKVRGGWWNGVIGNLEMAVNKDFIQDAPLRQQIYQFVRKVEKMQFGDDTPASRRTAEEIKWANEFIDTVLEQTGYANVLLDLSSLETKTE